MNDTVMTEHPDYHAVKPRYRLVRDIINNTAKHYIRHPCGQTKYPIYNDAGAVVGYGSSISKDDQARNEAYAEHAVLTNFTGLTSDGLTGLVFRKPPVIELPTELEYMLEDCTGTGIDLYQFSQSGVQENIQVGREFILLDYNQETKQAYFVPYVAENVINWKTRRVRGKVQPYLITLVEYVEASNDKFCQTLVPQYRVLLLDGDNKYYQELYNKDGLLVSTILPLDFNGVQYDYIPGVFVGSKNNDWTVDKVPLYDMAVINLAHYRNSADNEEAVFLCGQPYLVISVGDSSVEEFLEANPDGVYFGSRKAVLLPLNGNASILQALPNTMVRQAMIDKLEEAARIGARFIDPAGGRETAIAAKIRYGSQISSLTVLTYNFTNAINAMIKLACIAMGISDAEFKYQLNDVFFDDVPDANVIGQMLVGVQNGVISVPDLNAYGRLTGFIADDRSDEEIAEDIQKRLNKTPSVGPTATTEDNPKDDVNA